MHAARECFPHFHVSQLRDVQLLSYRSQGPCRFLDCLVTLCLCGLFFSACGIIFGIVCHASIICDFDELRQWG